jgi:hypothetical protein
VPLDRDDVFDLEGKKLFDAVYRDDGVTVKEKNEKVGKLRKQNTVFIRGYNTGKEELDKQEFVTVAEAWAKEHPDGLYPSW